MPLQELDLKELAKVIKGLLDEKGWNQTELADKIPVSQPTIHKWMKVLKDPNFKPVQPEKEHLERLANLAGKPMSEFLRPAMKGVTAIDESAAVTAQIPVTGYVVPPDGTVHLIERPIETLTYPVWWTSDTKLSALLCIKGGLGDAFKNWTAYYDQRRRTAEDFDCQGNLCLVMLDLPVIGVVEKRHDGFSIQPINPASREASTASGFEWCSPILWLHSPDLLKTEK